MGWHTGTANDHKDLLAKIIAAAVADGWTQKRYTQGEPPLANLAFTGTMDEAILEGPGYGPGYEVYVGIRTVETATSNIYCLRFNGMTNYDDSKVFDQQPGISPQTHLNVWNTPIVYWISISDRRILVIAKCSNTYHSVYAGLILPFSSPVEFPYPFYLGGDSASALQFGDTGNDTRGANAPGNLGGWFRDAGGIWRCLCVYSGDNYGYFQSWDGTRYTIYPYAGMLGHSADNPNQDASIPATARFEPLTGFPASMPMMPCYVQALFNGGGYQGALEGIFWIPGNTFSAEQEIDNGSDTYKVFIQISRSYEQPSPYYAVKEA